MKSRGTDIVVNNLGSSFTPEAVSRRRARPHHRTARRRRDLRDPGGAHEHREQRDDDRLRARMGRLFLGQSEGRFWPVAARRFRESRGARHDRGGDAQQKSGRPASARNRGAFRRRHRGWRRGRGKRLGHSFAVAAPGNHGITGQDQHHRRPRDAGHQRGGSADSSAPRSPSGFPKRARSRRTSTSALPGLPAHQRHELGHLAARRPGRRARRDEHDADDGFRAEAGDFHSARHRLAAIAHRAA